MSHYGTNIFFSDQLSFLQFSIFSITLLKIVGKIGSFQLLKHNGTIKCLIMVQKKIFLNDHFNFPDLLNPSLDNIEEIGRFYHWCLMGQKNVPLWYQNLFLRLFQFSSISIILYSKMLKKLVISLLKHNEDKIAHYGTKGNISQCGHFKFSNFLNLQWRNKWSLMGQ